MEASSKEQVEIYLEIGKKRTFAGALDWPGWSRSGRDEEFALQSLLIYGPRYSRVLHPAGIYFQAPSDASAFRIVERLDGNATTDFGAPDASPSVDATPVNEVELHRLTALLEACWIAFDHALKANKDKELSKGPRGGGRELEGIFQHVINSESAYLSKIGGKFKMVDEDDSERELRRIRPVIMDTLAAAVHGELPTHGPRGGSYWTPRYFVRRSAWHVLDHTWEIEDRVI